MAAKSEPKRLSTRWLLPFKITVFVIYSTLYAALLMLFLSTDDDWWWQVFHAVFYGYMFVLLFRMLAGLKYTTFDDHDLIVLHNRTEILIPLENIKDVEIKTVGGVYKVTLKHPDIFGDHFYFKPSMLYPFNYAVKDELVDLLRHKIDLAKKRPSEARKNVLMS